MMEEFEKWLRRMHDENDKDIRKGDFYKGIDRALVEVLLKYRSMTCKMEAHTECDTPYYECDECGETMQEDPNYCPNCGRKVVE